MKFSSYCVLSLLGVAAVAAHAWLIHGVFFRAAVQVYTSKLSNLIVMNGVFVVACLLCLVLKRMFIGTSGTADVEAVIGEHIRSTLVDTLLMMTIFREDLNARFMRLFLTLLAVKVFHHLANGTMEKMAQAPTMFSTWAKFRLTALYLTLLLLDAWWIHFCLNDALVEGPSVLIMFLLEYTLLFIFAIQSGVKFVLNAIEARFEDRWHDKEIMEKGNKDERDAAKWWSIYLLYIEFLLALLRFVTHVVFFGAIMALFGLPLHVIRPMYTSWRSFVRSSQSLLNARKVMKDMNERFPNATPEELADASICIVCRYEMHEGKRLPCGHVLHFWCLRDWLLQQSWCPICHHDVRTAHPSTAPPNTAPPGALAPGVGGPVHGAAPMEHVGMVPAVAGDVPAIAPALAPTPAPRADGAGAEEGVRNEHAFPYHAAERAPRPAAHVVGAADLGVGAPRGAEPRSERMPTPAPTAPVGPLGGVVEAARPHDAMREIKVAVSLNEVQSQVTELRRQLHGMMTQLYQLEAILESSAVVDGARDSGRYEAGAVPSATAPSSGRKDAVPSDSGSLEERDYRAQVKKEVQAASDESPRGSLAKETLIESKEEVLDEEQERERIRRLRLLRLSGDVVSDGTS